MGRSGREALAKNLPGLKTKLSPDVIIVNGENAAHGLGITGKICEEFYDLGVDCITTGNHVWDQREIIPYIKNDPKLLRPINFPDEAAGRGLCVLSLQTGEKIAVINVMARLFMDPLDDPFRTVDKALESLKLGQNVQAVFVDFHGEATSEKMAFAHYFDGRVSAVVGTHTHVPTADCQIFSGGTAYQSDAGMSGDYNSVIGMRTEISLQRFLKKKPPERMVPADGEGTLCGCLIETSDQTGLAVSIAPVRSGGRLQPACPER